MIEEFSVNINAYDFQKMTALHLAAKRDHSAVVEYLLEHKADFEIANAVGQTPLHVAAQAGAYNAAHVLIQHGADPNTTSDHDVRPIHRVSKKGFHELASLLLKAGADLHSIDSFLCESAIHHAALEGHTEVIRLLMCYAKKSLDDANIRGETALHMAASNNHVECCRLLVTMGITAKWKLDFLNRKDLRQEETALHKACAAGHTQIARLLLDAKAVPDIQNITGRTPLHFAAAGEDPLLVSFLLRAGSDHLIIDCDGKQPAHRCTHESVRRALGIAAGITANIQQHNTMQRQAIIEGKRRNIFADEHRRATGTKDAADLRAKLRAVAVGRQARALQARIDSDQQDLCERLRRSWAQKVIARAYATYRTDKKDLVLVLFPSVKFIRPCRCTVAFEHFPLRYCPVFKPFSHVKR
jgi:ankyrin repeat protein